MPQKKYFIFDDNEWSLDFEVLTVHSVPAAGRHQAMVQIHCAGLSVQQDCGMGSTLQRGCDQIKA